MLVSELDLECELWIKLRLAPLPPHVGTISLAFVGQPTVRVQLAPYNRVRLMRIPILQVRGCRPLASEVCCHLRCHLRCHLDRLQLLLAHDISRGMCSQSLGATTASFGCCNASLQHMIQHQRCCCMQASPALLLQA